MIWCAGCSTGEEPYSLAMVLNEFAEQNREFRFLVLATDISSKVLEQARLGIYEEEHIESIPLSLRKKYLLRSKEKDKNLVRIIPELRAFIRFRRLNFMDTSFGLRELMDIVFCRNVIIYFDRPTQEAVLNRICSYLQPGGYLFTGHSETLNGMNLPLNPVSHTVYKQMDKAVQNPKELPIVYLKPAELCVTDQPTVVRTVLGSCLAVTMFHPRLKISAICHALLPEPDMTDTEEEKPLNPYKYVNSVIPKMMAKMRNYGIALNEIEVKLFGGADLLSSSEERIKNQPVGRLNVKTALNILEAEGLRVSVSDVGGTLGRKIFFYTHTGEVLLKRLASGIFPPEQGISGSA
jgi:chemotaxis receptor (MCP) glutamine deamidase CheD